jgi:hypothetical protein
MGTCLRTSDDSQTDAAVCEVRLWLEDVSVIVETYEIPYSSSRPAGIRA